MSKIEVNTIDTQCGSALQIGDGNTATIGLGKSGDTITVPCGATIVNSGTATGFGRTGTVDWVTTVKVTGDSPITAVTGEGYFLNTTAGTITVNLPAGAAGSIISLADYASTWQTNNVTVSANGSEKIGGNTSDAVLSTQGQSVTLVYVDGTQGWVTTADSTENIIAKEYVTATGGTPCSGAIVCTNYKTHTFTGPGTFCVSAAGNPAGSNTVDYMVVAGGGGGGGGYGAGGGAGGYRESPGTASGCYSVSPLGAAPATALSVTATPYTITVGGGGPGGTSPPSIVGTKGNDSVFSTITSTGGGYGAGGYNASAPVYTGGDGGSGGGGGSPTGTGVGVAGSGNTPPAPVAQGKDGGTGAHDSVNFVAGGGGGGATVIGGTIGLCFPVPGPGAAGAGGTGATSSINATPTERAGGGGGAGHTPAPVPGGAATGGGGAGGSPGAAAAGTVNTGGGGGGGADAPAPTETGGTGGSGIVIIRYKFQ